MSDPKRVLFVCEGNRARSQMAEAMLRHHGAGSFDVFSAGIRPGEEVPAFTIAALEEAHYPAGGLRSKHYGEFADEEFDFLIVLCDTVRAEAPDLPRAQTRLDWKIEDPGDARKRGVPIEEALRENRAVLRSHIVRFMEEQGCMADWHEAEGGEYFIDEYSCPFPKIAERDRSVCALHVEFVRTLTGADTRLTRSLMRGERACTYRIRPAAVREEDLVPVAN